MNTGADEIRRLLDDLEATRPPVDERERTSRERFRTELAAISRHGCILRDLELGLIDFYTMAQGRVVCLCWRRGEPRIEHWHPLDEGFSGRRRLSELL